MSHKTENGTVWEGVTPNRKGNAVCDKCGGVEFKMVSHFDGADVYWYTYKCAKCGAIISMTAKRTERW